MTQTREAFDAALPKYRFDPSSSPHEFRSPIEWTGHWFIHKVLKAEAPLPAEPLVIMGEVFPPPLAVLAVEVPIKTRMGTFFGDAVVHTPGKNTLVEYDGRTYHPDWGADHAAAQPGAPADCSRAPGAEVSRPPRHGPLADYPRDADAAADD